MTRCQNQCNDHRNNSQVQLLRFLGIEEPDYYSHCFFSFLFLDSQMRRNFCSVCSTKRVPRKRI